MANMKVRNWNYSEDDFETEFKEATRRGRDAALSEPRAVDVSYDSASERIIIDLNNGVSIAFPKDYIEELVGATPEQVSDVEVSGPGTGLRWNSLDVDLGVPELCRGIYGTRKWMARLGQMGGSVTSEKKATAARENGRKGGRPPGAKLSVDVRTTNEPTAKCTIAASEVQEGSRLAAQFEQLVLDLTEALARCRASTSHETSGQALSVGPERGLPVVIGATYDNSLTAGTEVDNAAFALAA